ncbi:MAG TPA: hypothetical protein VFM98_07205 [Ramlibacter sp.]|uniref:hypothetical protein n=1 Tax=Ramlibacter sp. TaxID=1917967 RepID=UPI002D7F525D|nr:hypothetical protein [Ramlibacter sp.]HET8745375.1 hypothetical protein [Ramlibacter sp.]
MSPLLIRIFTLVGMALAAASMQLKARAETAPPAPVQAVQAAAGATFAGHPLRATS